ncbi:hypothetical protein AOL_s00079g263 [Orbilia oligospora ATCC 24927]|uniref:DUF7779 domain-containing protein n=1 Tax=Arthrobotrys oligospora (strain ATCC 24927 / CBS 115.81 / DSM 1491) TaxID=756982 RepID=G1XCU3_ARTOA|nr:hypothetical protein AOL_s00079g263 [Orbilia oligospora ATCC 24927]EGX49042.1 hypothetical protein AOL_s00079g263 [Orbilia oligospora ATCC 24927]
MLLSRPILIINILSLVTAKTIPIEEYKIGWISALPIEFAAARAVLDEEYEAPEPYTRLRDDNAYVFGRIGSHNTIIACLPAGRYGTASAAAVASQMYNTFPGIKLSLMVGVGGGAPSGRNDIREDSVRGKIYQNWGIERAAFIGPERMADAVQRITEKDDRFSYPGKGQDRLFRPEYEHIDGKLDCVDHCDFGSLVHRDLRAHEYPLIHYGIIASANQVMKHATTRDRIANETGAICFEMEAGGLMNLSPTLVVRGICDYSDSHKNKIWQPYAALTAAVYAKELLKALHSRALLSTAEYSQSKEGDRLGINYSIPFKITIPRLKSFVGRNDTILAIYNYYSSCKILNGQSSTPCLFAITGLGGAGKTQIALEYAYRYKKDFTSIFWIHAESEGSIQRSILTAMQQIVDEQAKYAFPGRNPNCSLISDVLKMPRLIDEDCIIQAPNSKDQVKLKNAFISWLESHPHNSHEWLLVLDNADDLEAVNLEDYLPKLGWGSILITSRRQEFGPEIEQVNLQGLEPRFASQLLLQVLGIDKVNEVLEADSIALVEELGLIPLAIAQAGYFIRKEKIHIKEYIRFHSNLFMEVHSQKPRVGWNYGISTVATTWEASFRAVEKHDKNAARMLLACSFLDPSRIQEVIFLDPAPDIETKLQVKSRIRVLQSYSLIQRLDSGSFAIHPLVHAWARGRLSEPEHLQVIIQAMNIVGNFARREMLLPENHMAHFAPHLEYLSRHLKLRLTQIFSLPDPITEPQNLLIEIFLRTREALQPYGRVKEAKFWRRQAARAALILILRDGNISRFFDFENSADVFSRQGRVLEAKARYGIATYGYIMTAALHIRKGFSFLYEALICFKCSTKLYILQIRERVSLPICVTALRVDEDEVFDAEQLEGEIRESSNRAAMFPRGADSYPEETLYHKASRYIFGDFDLKGRLESDISSSTDDLESYLDFAEGEGWETKTFKLISSIYMPRSFPEKKVGLFEPTSPKQGKYFEGHSFQKTVVQKQLVIPDKFCLTRSNILKHVFASLLSFLSTLARSLPEAIIIHMDLFRGGVGVRRLLTKIFMYSLGLFFLSLKRVSPTGYDMLLRWVAIKVYVPYLKLKLYILKRRSSKQAQKD